MPGHPKRKRPDLRLLLQWHTFTVAIVNLDWLVVEDPTFRLVLQIGGALLVIAGILIFLLNRSFQKDPPYRGERRRRFKATPWQRDPYSGQRLRPLPPCEPEREEPPADFSRLIYPPFVPPRTAFAMPREDRPTHHRATGSRREQTRKLHPGDVTKARAMVTQGEMYPPEDEPYEALQSVLEGETMAQWERRRLRAGWRENLEEPWR